MVLLHGMKFINQKSFLMGSSEGSVSQHGYKYTWAWGGNAEKAMAPHSNTLAWKIPWMEEPGRLQSMGLLRVGHN